MLDDSLLEIFREEAREHLGALETGFLDLEGAAALPVRRGLIDGLFRHAHSLKGDAKAMGIDELKSTAQALEDLLDKLRDNPDQIAEPDISGGLALFDLVRNAFDDWMRRRQGVDPASSASPAVAVRTEIPTQVDVPADSPQQEVSVPAASTSTATAEESFTVRVPSERLDRMLNLAGEVRTSQRAEECVRRRIGDLTDHLKSTMESLPALSPGENRRALEIALDQLRRIDDALHDNGVRETLLTSDLENDIRQARLLPLVMLTDSLRRAVRDLSHTLKKDIRYEVDVGSIMLDKAVIEALKDPLLHLLRNAADHGIETVEERTAAGKSAEGFIRIQAQQRGPIVTITCSDDGRGINFSAIRARLRRTGILSDPEATVVSDADLIPYLFKPGFTTALVGETSGRGVGLDVVLDTLRRLQGRVELDSTSSRGTCFRLAVPMTISTVRVLTVMAGGQYFGIPVSAVERTARARPEELRLMGRGRVISIGGEAVRWCSMAELTGIVADKNVEPGHKPYLLVNQDGVRTAIAVDDCEEEAEVLLKPLGFPLSRMPCVVGATIRPDGAVQLVLDVAELLRNEPETGSGASGNTAAQQRRILLVDDSPTTRAILRSVFAAAGYSVATATDGIDALERLRTQPVDLVVSDVEMPRLNGFDLTRRIKARFDCPVVLVTGLEKEQHRREGLLAGADAFVVKSTFEGEGLLEIVEQLI